MRTFEEATAGLAAMAAKYVQLGLIGQCPEHGAELLGALEGFAQQATAYVEAHRGEIAQHPEYEPLVRVLDEVIDAYTDEEFAGIVEQEGTG